MCGPTNESLLYFFSFFFSLSSFRRGQTLLAMKAVAWLVLWWTYEISLCAAVSYGHMRYHGEMYVHMGSESASAKCDHGKGVEKCLGILHPLKKGKGERSVAFALYGYSDSLSRCKAQRGYLCAHLGKRTASGAEENSKGNAVRVRMSPIKALRVADSVDFVRQVGKVAAHIMLPYLLAVMPVGAMGDAFQTQSSSTVSSPVHEQLHQLTARIKRLEAVRMGQASKTAASFELVGTPPVTHTDEEFESLRSKLESKMKAQNIADWKRRAKVSRMEKLEQSFAIGDKYRTALKDAGYSLLEANRLLILEAWDIIHRGSYGYPGWYDPNNGLYVNHESFMYQDRKEIISSLSQDDLSSTVSLL